MLPSAMISDHELYPLALAMSRRVLIHSGLVYRAVHTDFEHDRRVLYGLNAMDNGGRGLPSNQVAAMYAGNIPGVAYAEFLATQGRYPTPAIPVILEGIIQNYPFVDFRHPFEDPRLEELRQRFLNPDDWAFSQRLGLVFIELGLPGVAWTSLRGDGIVLLLYANSERLLPPEFHRHQ